MTTSKHKTQGAKVPASRLSRASQFGRLAFNIASNVVISGAKEMSKGNKVNTKDLLLTPTNIEKVANKLTHLRGAAMKLGQMISMDAGELLPPELSTLLSKLRSNASPMPHKQLVTILERKWGANWVDNFAHFDLRPFAAASIGQVHLAQLADGQKLAVKIQYPGVKDSIQSDVDNVATLLKMSGFLPAQVQIDDLLVEAKQQLQQEADYQLEADFIEGYSACLAHTEYQLPQVYSELSDDSILTMSYVEGSAIENAEALPQAVRNHIVERLIRLFMQELFDFKLMQTDPNFANFLYQSNTDTIGLLDFGATREIPEHVSQGYLTLINAGLKQDQAQMLKAAEQIGFFDNDIADDYLADVIDIFYLACEPLQFNGDYDFAASGLAQKVKEKGLAITQHKNQWHTPPVDALFIHRKLGGLYLLATKLGAKVNVKQLFAPYISE